MKTLLLAILLGLFGSQTFAAQTNVNFTRTEDILYGRKHGTALTMDMFDPADRNGHAVLFLVSGGFFSSHAAIAPAMYQPFLRRGYTVFAVVHGSQPKFVIPEIMEDIHRAVRFVRSNAKQYKIEPNQLGMTGASAGGHLSLTMATQGGRGLASAKDPIDRESSAIQAVACFFPPTDFLHWGTNQVDAVGVGPLEKFQPAFGSRSDTTESRKIYGREISPLNFVRSNMAPILIIHGDADRLVPIQQAEIFVRRCEQMQTECKLIVREGKDHGWPELKDDLEIFADWFDLHLRGVAK